MPAHHRPLQLVRIVLVAACGLLCAAAPAAAQQGWSPAISTVGGSDAPNVVVDRAGWVTVVWSGAIATRRAPDSDQWQAPIDLGPPGERFGARVAVDRDGNVMVAWVWRSADGLVVQAARYSTLVGTWVGPVTLSPPFPLGTGAKVAVDPLGNATIAWWQGDSPDTWRVRAIRYTVTTDSWGNAVALSSPGLAPPSSLDLVADAAGNVTVAWVLTTGGLTPRFTVQASRFATGTGGWSAAVNLSVPIPAPGWAPVEFWGVVGDMAGNVTVVWAGYGDGTANPSRTPYRTVQASRASPVGATWSPAVDVSRHWWHGEHDDGRALVDAAGTVTVIWVASLDELSPKLVWAARWAANRAAFTEPRPISDPADRGWNGHTPKVAVDGVGRVTVLWWSNQAARYAPASDSWSAPLRLPALFTDQPLDSRQITVDGAGNLFVSEFQSPGVRAMRYTVATGELTAPEWVHIGPDGASGRYESLELVVDPAGRATAVWSRCRLGFPIPWCFPSVTESRRWLTTPSAPTPVSTRPGDGTLVVGFDAPRTTDPAFAPTDYEYSLDDGATWRARTPPSTASPIRIGGLTNGVTYRIRLRARNSTGAGAASQPVLATPVPAPNPPTGLTVVARAGATLTLGWIAPAGGLQPTGYVIEGGSQPGEVLASVPTGGTVPVFTFTAPSGTHYVRLHAIAGTAWSAPSNEIRVFVNVPTPPAAPTNLLGLANGSSLELSWTNALEGGTPTGLWLNVSRAITTTVPLPMGESFTYANVPPGSYTLNVSASGPGGMSVPSNSLTLTFPSSCGGVPEAPTGLQAWTVGHTVFVTWPPPVAGTAVTSYTLWVGGAWTGSIMTTGRALSGAAAPGSYELSVTAHNACGVGPPTPAQTVVIP